MSLWLTCLKLGMEKRNIDIHPSSHNTKLWWINQSKPYNPTIQIRARGAGGLLPGVLQAVEGFPQQAALRLPVPGRDAGEPPLVRSRSRDLNTHSHWCRTSSSRRSGTWPRRGGSKQLLPFLLRLLFSHKFQRSIARCRAISKENKQFKETVETQERMIESQNFVMTNLRNGIDYLKATCKNAGTM